MAVISFVVPVYKIPYEYLQQCIDSILQQENQNIELVLVDDGSPDDCGKICDLNARKDPRVQVVHKSNGGLSDARNAGISVCTGQWVTFVDADDWVDKGFTSSFLDRIGKQETQADIYIYMGYRNYVNKQVFGDAYFQDGRRFTDYAEREFLQTAFCRVPMQSNGEGLFIGSACAKVYNVDFLKKSSLEFIKIPYGEDSLFYLYSIEKANCVEYVAEAYYHYRDTEGSMVNKYRENADKEQDIYLQELFGFVNEYAKGEEFVAFIYIRVFQSMQRCISQKFYNSENSLNQRARKKQCKTFFSKQPYCDCFQYIRFADLNRNSKIKYLLMRLGLFGLLVELKRQYDVQNGKAMHHR